MVRHRVGRFHDLRCGERRFPFGKRCSLLASVQTHRSPRLSSWSGHAGFPSNSEETRAAARPAPSIRLTPSAGGTHPETAFPVLKNAAYDIVHKSAGRRERLETVVSEPNQAAAVRTQPQAPLLVPE